MSDTELRIHNLEQQVRRQRRWNLTLGAVLIVGGLLAATAERGVPEIIEAKSFAVVDDKGNPLVVMAPNPLGHGSVTVIKKRKGLVQGETIAVLSSDETGAGGLDVFGRDGKTRIASLGSDPAGNGALAVFAKSGKQVVQLSPDAEGDGALNIFNRNGKTMIAAVGADPAGHGALSVFSRTGTQVFQVSPDPAGDGVLSVLNRHGRPVVSLEADDEGSGVVGTLNKSGELTSILPGT